MINTRKVAIIYINKKCNLNCPFCYVQKNGKEMTYETADKLIKYLENNLDKYEGITFVGGETLLSAQLLLRFIHALSSYKKMEFFSIMTNGTIPIKPFHEQLLDREMEKVWYNISIKNLNEPYIERKEKNYEYLFKNDSNFVLLTVNTPQNIPYLLQLVDYMATFRPYGIKILRQHMMGDFWTKEDVQEYAKILPVLIYKKLFFEQSKGPMLILPNKPEITISESGSAYNKHGVSVVDQDSICVNKIIGLDGKVYHCDAACGAGDHSYGYIWEDKENPWEREFGYQDILYDYCERAKKRICPEFDELNDAWRKRILGIRNKIQLLAGRS